MIVDLLTIPAHFQRYRLCSANSKEKLFRLIGETRDEIQQ